MTGFPSRARDVINQAAGTHATVTVADRGLSTFLDPSMTGATRFMQRSGYPFALLTPQMTASLSDAAAAGTRAVYLTGTRLLAWLTPGMTVSFELLETGIVESVQELDDGSLFLLLDEPLASSHAAGTKCSIRRFPITAYEDTIEGAGAVGSGVVTVVSPFLLVPGDMVIIAESTYVLARVEQLGGAPTARIYGVQVAGLGGLPALTTATRIAVGARPAYRSEILSLPHTRQGSMVGGPFALDWVSGPTVAGYRPTPESEVFVEQFNAAGVPLADPQRVEKNDTIMRLPILREQMLFWRVVEGGANWNGTFFELKAFASGRAHVWTPCRPPLDPAPVTTVARVVPLFAPFTVLLLSRITPGSVTVVDEETKGIVPSSDYTVDETTGSLVFVSARGGQPVLVTYQPRLEWQLLARPSEPGLELVVTVGQEAQQVFALGAAGAAMTLTVKTQTAVSPDQLHVTARRASDEGGAFIVELGDWQVRGGATAALRYTLTTGAEQDYDWASSGLLLKPIWPVLEVLRARLDGTALFARALDNGRALL